MCLQGTSECPAVDGTTWDWCPPRGTVLSLTQASADGSPYCSDVLVAALPELKMRKAKLETEWRPLATRRPLEPSVETETPPA